MNNDPMKPSKLKCYSTEPITIITETYVVRLTQRIAELEAENARLLVEIRKDHEENEKIIAESEVIGGEKADGGGTVKRLTPNVQLDERTLEYGRMESEIEALRADLEKAHKDTERLLAIANGCHDYGGGYKNPRDYEIFHHGIQTVINALTAATQGNDLQLQVLESIGRKAIDAAMKEKK